MSVDTLENCRVLLVEDQLIIAMDVEFILTQNGVGTIDTATTVAEALGFIASSHPDAAILDFNLGQGSSLPVAEVLLAEGIPFVFATGYGDNSMIPRQFDHIPIISKPYDAAKLVNLLSQSIAAAQQRPKAG